MKTLSKSRWHALVSVVTAVAIVAVVIGATLWARALWRDADARDNPDAQLAEAGATLVPFDVYQSEYGIRLGFDVTPDDSRRYAQATVQFGDETRSHAGYFMSERWDEHYPAPDPFPVKAGTKVFFEFSELPDCGEPAADSILVRLDSTNAAEEPVSETYSASNIDEYQQAYAERCEAGVYVSVAGGRWDPDDGAAEATGIVINPGPGTATVVIPDYDEGDTHWDGTTLTVAPGELEQFTLTGIGTDCALDGQAWTEGRVTVNGEPYDVNAEDGWCG